MFKAGLIHNSASFIYLPTQSLLTQSNVILFIEQMLIMYIRMTAHRKQSYTLSASYTINDTIYWNAPSVLSKMEVCISNRETNCKEEIDLFFKTSKLPLGKMSSNSNSPQISKQILSSLSNPLSGYAESLSNLKRLLLWVTKHSSYKLKSNAAANT